MAPDWDVSTFSKHIDILLVKFQCVLLLSTFSKLRYIQNTTDRHIRRDFNLIKHEIRITLSQPHKEFAGQRFQIFKFKSFTRPSCTLWYSSKHAQNLEIKLFFTRSGFENALCDTSLHGNFIRRNMSVRKLSFAHTSHQSTWNFDANV